MICSIITAIMAMVVLVFVVSSNIVISKKRNYVYNQTIKNKKLYDEGIKKLNQLLNFPQTSLNLSCTMLYLSSTKMLQSNFTEALENFDMVKEFDKQFKVGTRNSALASYYKILIYFYVDEKESLKKELQYFDDLLSNKKNKKIFENIVMCVDAIEKNNLDGLLQNLKYQKNSFVELLIKKIS